MRYRSIAVITAASAIVFPQIASAADMPVKAPVAPIVPAVHNWTGFYVGLNAGGAWSSGDANYTLPPFLATGAGTGPAGDSGSAAAAVASTHVSDSGFTGGGQVGYNWQFNNVVLGLEADFNAMNLDNSATATGLTTPGFPTWSNTVQTSINTDWLLTARPRIGYAWNNVLIYATGGLAVTELKLSQSQVNKFPAGTTTQWVESVSSNVTKAGWTVGGGLEYALSNNWSIKGEYLYANFGHETVSGTTINTGGFALGGQTFTHTFNLHVNIARAGINYKF